MRSVIGATFPPVTLLNMATTGVLFKNALNVATGTIMRKGTGPDQGGALPAIRKKREEAFQEEEA